MIKQGTDNIYETKNKNSKNRVVIGIKERRFHVWLESTPFLVEETDCDKRPYIWQNQYNIVKLKKKKEYGGSTRDVPRGRNELTILGTIRK